MLYIYARLCKKGFSCKTLSGIGEYSLSVNSDMTLSCTCMDFEGRGYLGDLRKQTILQLFNGDIANSFRKSLSIGWLPIVDCVRCPWLSLRPTDNKGFPKSVIIENTWKCNLACTSCKRNTYKKTRFGKALINEAELDSVAKELSTLKVTDIGFYKLGEPFLDKDIVGKLRIIRKYLPDVYLFVTTNGMFYNEEAMLMFDCVSFSIDGIDNKLVRRYQKGGDFARMFGNMQKLAKISERKTKIQWQYVLFNWNDKPANIEAAIALAKSCGIDYLKLVKTTTPLIGISLRARLSKYYKKFQKNSAGDYLIKI